MKTTRLKIALLAALAAMAMVPSASRAASDILIAPSGATANFSTGSGNQTSSSGTGGVWQNWYVNIGGATDGITNYDISFDTTTIPPTGATAGSMLQKQGWNGAFSGSEITFACIDGNFWGGATFDASQYATVEMDFKYDTTSTMTPATSGNVEIHVDNHLSGGGSDGISLTNLANNGVTAGLFDGAWHHVSVPIPSSIAPAAQCKGPGFKIFHNSAVSGTFNYWIANIKLAARVAAIPAPTISLDKAKPGLRMFADVTPNYNRQDLRTDTSAPGSKNIDWIGHPGATYSWTVVDFPGAGTPNFQIALALTPDAPQSMTYADPDWSATNVLWLQIQGNNDGSVRSSLAWKTNQQAGNSQYYSASLGQLYQNFNTPTAIGTWSLSFPNNTSVTLTAPGGLSTNVALPAAMFLVPYTDISCALMSGMNNNDSLVGKSATISSFNITGVANPVSENLTDGGLSTPFLTLQSQNYGGNPTPVNQTFVQGSDAYWLHWTLPDNNYFLVEKPNLTTIPYWLDYAPGTSFQNGAGKWVLVSSANLPNPSSAYFAMQQRTNSQMQVLLPWETPAPNTPTGKTGTQPAGSVSLSGNSTVDVTIRAVDANWNLIPSSDSVGIASNDPNSNVPTAIPLVGGVATFSGINVLGFGSTGTFTISVTNLNKAYLPVGTSSPVIVVP